MVRTLFFFIFLGFYMIFSLLYFIPYFLLWLFRREEAKKNFVKTVSKIWARHLLWATGSKVTVAGSENIPSENVLIVGNHQSDADILIVIAYMPKMVGFIAKKELKSLPLISVWMKVMHCIFLDRKSMRKSAEEIMVGVEYLKQGYTLVIFPEGHRSKSPEMGKFKAGSLKLATLSGAKVLPITISGSYKIFEAGRKIAPADVKLTFHKTIDTAKLSENEKEGLVQTLEKTIASAI